MKCGSHGSQTVTDLGADLTPIASGSFTIRDMHAVSAARSKCSSCRQNPEGSRPVDWKPRTKTQKEPSSADEKPFGPFRHISTSRSRIQSQGKLMTPNNNTITHHFHTKMRIPFANHMQSTIFEAPKSTFLTQSLVNTEKAQKRY